MKLWNWNDDMDVKQIGYEVIGAAMRVHSHFGAGYLEEVYKNALMVELREHGMIAESEVPITIDCHGVRVGDYRADIMVENRMIVELKVVSMLLKRHEAQLVNYLVATGINDGILLNFGVESLQYKHKFRVHHNPVDPVNPV